MSLRVGGADSHSSVKATTAGVDEASDHSVEDERQNLQGTQEQGESVGSAAGIC